MIEKYFFDPAKNILFVTVAGELSISDVKKIHLSLFTLLQEYPGCRLLVDAQNMKILQGDGSITLALEKARHARLICSELGDAQPLAIADIVPRRQSGRSIVNEIEAAMQVQGFRYRMFVNDYDGAESWLSTI